MAGVVDHLGVIVVCCYGQEFDLETGLSTLERRGLGQRPPQSTRSGGVESTERRTTVVAAGELFP
jgi:hypothetical protein